MRFSFYCKHCHTHLKKGDHSACRKILQKQDAAERERLAKIHGRCENTIRKNYADGKAADYFENFFILTGPKDTA